MRADAWHDVTLARYEREQNRLAREECWIQNRSCELMQDEYNPEDPDVFLDTLANAGDDLKQELLPLLKKTSWDYEEIGKVICNWVEERCIEESEQQAQDELEEERKHQ